MIKDPENLYQTEALKVRTKFVRIARKEIRVRLRELKLGTFLNIQLKKGCGAIRFFKRLLCRFLDAQSSVEHGCGWFYH